MPGKIFVIILSFMLILPLCSCTAEEKSFSDGGYYLNTMISVTAYGENCEKGVKEAMAEIERVEKLLSAYVETSEIYLINSKAFSEPVEVSSETASILSKALDFSRKTNGAFDITVKPLVDLWNVTAENPKVPSDDEINSVMDAVGYENVIIENNTVKLLNEKTKLDLGGAAKGYCADRAVEILKENGIKNAILDLGGNVYALGNNTEGNPWRIGLQDPGGERGEHFRVEELTDKTAVTSGSYERYFESGGKIYHHIINPETGYPSDSNLISATVISSNSFEADMISTAVFVMGAENFNKIKNSFEFEKIITVDKTNREYVITK